MIPRHATDLVDLRGEAERQLEEIHELFGAYSAVALSWRPNDEKWSAAGHLVHLCVVNGRYLDAIEARTRRARTEKGPVGEGPYRHPLFASWLVRSMEPPPKRRVRTMRSMVPDPATGSAEALARFGSLQRRLIDQLVDARGLDLGRVRFRSPFAAVVRLSLGTAFELLLAHSRRHIWLMREVLGWEGSPAGESRGSEG